MLSSSILRAHLQNILLLHLRSDPTFYEPVRSVGGVRVNNQTKPDGFLEDLSSKMKAGPGLAALNGSLGPGLAQLNSPGGIPVLRPWTASNQWVMEKISVLGPCSGSTQLVLEEFPAKGPGLAPRIRSWRNRFPQVLDALQLKGPGEIAILRSWTGSTTWVLEESLS